VKVFANSVQKSGTHLLLRLFELAGVPRYPRWRLDPEWTRERSVGKRVLMRPPGLGTAIPIGQGVDVSSWWIARLARRMPTDSALLGHASWSSRLHDLLTENGVRIACVVRDPRDVVVSYAHFLVKIGKDKITRRPEHRALLALPDHRARLVTMIRGNEGTQSVPDRFRAFLPWLSREDVLVLRFEDLVGAAGGGDDATQRREVARSLAWVGRPRTGTDLDVVCAGLWGGTATFRKGQIGQWREEFDADLSALAEREMADVIAALGYAPAA
jgi:sulfotransferase family protein